MSNETKSNNSSASCGCGCLINALFGWMSVGYLLNFWGAALNFSQSVIEMPFVAKFIIGLLLGSFTIPLAIASWILSFFWTP